MSEPLELPGHLVKVGEATKWMCDFPLPGPGKKTCGALIKDNDKGRASHRKVHDPKSQYTKEHRPFATPVICAEPSAKAPLGKCTFEMTNKHNMLAHHMRDHDHSGDKQNVFAKYLDKITYNNNSS